MVRRRDSINLKGLKKEDVRQDIITGKESKVWTRARWNDSFHWNSIASDISIWILLTNLGFNFPNMRKSVEDRRHVNWFSKLNIQLIFSITHPSKSNYVCFPKCFWKPANDMEIKRNMSSLHSRLFGTSEENKNFKYKLTLPYSPKICITWCFTKLKWITSLLFCLLCI